MVRDVFQKGDLFAPMPDFPVVEMRPHVFDRYPPPSYEPEPRQIVHVGQCPKCDTIYYSISDSESR